MVIEEDELIRNEDGEIVRYEGEGKAVAVFFTLGLIYGLLIGALFIPIPDQAQHQEDPYLMGDDRFCEEHNFENGYYTDTVRAPMEVALNSTVGIRCYNSTGSHLNDTWRMTAEADFYVNQDYEIIAKIEGENPGG